MSRNQVVLVDVNDRVIGREDKLHAHRYGQLHRAFSVFIARCQDGQVELLLQQRASTKYHCGGLWSNTCCSHPQPGEDTKQSALVRIEEELGFSLDTIDWAASHCYKATLPNGLVEHEFDHLFIGWHRDPKINANKDEIQDIKWLTLDEIDASLTAQPQLFTPWFADTFEKVRPQLDKCG